MSYQYNKYLLEVVMNKKIKLLAIFILFFAFAIIACTPGGSDKDGTSTYTVTYDGNTNTSGTIPIDTNIYLPTFTVTVLGNGTLVKVGYTFTCWNTQADGNGTDRAPSSTFAMGAANVILYAKWTADPTYTVTYDANTGTGGVPADSNNYLAGATVTVLGNGTLVKVGYTFTCWNTQADGNGTDRAPSSTFAMGAANVILYAKWTADPTYGLISYWKLNETSGTTAVDSFSGYTGTLTYTSPASTEPTFTTGKASNAISLSNGQYVTVPHNPALNITGDLTITMWVKPNSVTCSGADPAYVLISKRSSNIQEPYEFMIGCGGSLRYDARGTNITFLGAGTATGLVTTGSWQHVAMTRSYSGITATVTFYINGVAVGSSSQAGGPTLTNSDPVWISRSGYFTGYTNEGSYSGLMDEIAIFNRALSSSEILNIYNLTNAGSSFCQYALREPGPAGGLVFYDKGSYSDGWRYLEAAPSDESIQGMVWSNGSFTTTGATATAIGTGQANTTTIVNSQGAGIYAAQWCNDLTIGIFSDWFLPSKDELNQMYLNLRGFGVGNFNTDDPPASDYWSSSEDAISGGNAWVQVFSSGYQGTGGKSNNTLRVRAARAF